MKSQPGLTPEQSLSVTATIAAFFSGEMQLSAVFQHSKRQKMDFQSLWVKALFDHSFLIFSFAPFICYNKLNFRWSGKNFKENNRNISNLSLKIFNSVFLLLLWISLWISISTWNQTKQTRDKSDQLLQQTSTPERLNYTVKITDCIEAVKYLSVEAASTFFMPSTIMNNTALMEINKEALKANL